MNTPRPDDLTLPPTRPIFILASPLEQTDREVPRAKT
jgi:hypothetical protein